MENIEDTKESPIALEKSEDGISSYHWSEIQSPNFKEIPLSIFEETIALTQKINIKGETSKIHAQRPAIVIYDVSFLQYKLLEVIAPIICEYKEGEATGAEIEAFNANILALITTAIADAIKCHDDAIAMCGEMGIILFYTPKLLLRSFKLAKAKSYIHSSDSSIED